MMSERDEQGRRFTLCLVADEDVIERYSGMVRYLQIGLIDEAVDVVLVVPETSRTESVIAGPSAVVAYSRRRWPFDLLTRHQAARGMRELLDDSVRQQPMIVHALSPGAAHLASHLGAEFGAELVVTVTSSTIRRDIGLQHALDHAATLVFPSESLRESIANTPLATKCAEVVRPGVMAEESVAAFRNMGNVPSIVFAGYLGAECGADVLIRAVGRVVRERHRVLLFLAGKGPAEPELRHLVDTLKLAEHVTFTGRLDHLNAAMDSADIYCVPRALGIFREEPVLAMAAGMAMIVADGTYCDGLVDRENAWIISNADEDEMAGGILQMIGSPEQARAMGTAAREVSRAMYSVARMIGDLTRIYRRLVYRKQTLTIGGR